MMDLPQRVKEKTVQIDARCQLRNFANFVDMSWKVGQQRTYQIKSDSTKVKNSKKSTNVRDQWKWVWKIFFGNIIGFYFSFKVSSFTESVQGIAGKDSYPSFDLNFNKNSYDKDDDDDDIYFL